MFKAKADMCFYSASYEMRYRKTSSNRL